jgi:preprotein translocase subunit YajC
MYPDLHILAQATEDVPTEGAQPSSDPGEAAPAETATTQTGAPGGPAGPPKSSPPFFTNPLFGLTLVFVVFYFMLFRGKSKQQKKFNEMLQNLKKNDRVITVGGIIGTVVSASDQEVLIKVDESSNTKMKFVRKAIQRVLNEEAPAT